MNKKISAYGDFYVKNIFGIISLSSIIIIIINELGFFNVKFIYVCYFCSIFFGSIYLIFLRRIKKVYLLIDNKRDGIKINDIFIKINNIKSIKRYWLYYYKIEYIYKNKDYSDIFLIEPINLFVKSSDLSKLIKKINEN